MKMTKMALLAGAALTVTAAGAQADDLTALKAQIESLNARVAAMETAPSLPSGYSLLTVSEGTLEQTPGLGMTARELADYGNKATVIGILPTADAPAGTTISWSGYARAGLVYSDSSVDYTLRSRAVAGDPVDTDTLATEDVESDDIDVLARGEIRVKAATDTAVGEVGVDIRLRGNFNGSGNADIYADVAWGYWAMTPELTFGGGYAGSLGNIGYGYDGACSCYYTDNADVAFNPGDVTQLRLSYASGPVSFAIALEDGSTRLGADEFGAKDEAVNGDKLGAAGEIKYSGDAFSGEVSAVWRETDEETGADSLWQVGAGLGLSLGDVASLSLGAALGEGPLELIDDGAVTAILPYNQSWWGVSALASFNLSDEIHAELGAGYKKREGDDVTGTVAPFGAYTANAESETYALLAGIYYQPVDQLTIGVEAEWYKTDASLLVDSDATDIFSELDAESETTQINLVSVWRF